MSKVVFWLGPAVETFDFATALGTGIGGSETAAIHLSRCLAALGHDVDVYADVTSPAAWSDFVSNSGGVSGTLRAIPYRCWVPRTPCDVFVSSRSADARRVLLPHCRAAWLWVHDLHCGPDWEDSIGSDYDRVLCLSAWAREAFLRFYPGLDGSRVLVTSNGVDPTLFPGSPSDKHLDYALGRAPLRVTYSSSPDRGLDKLLDLWPTIYETCLRAGRLKPELHVYYGFETWRRLAGAPARPSGSRQNRAARRVGAEHPGSPLPRAGRPGRGRQVVRAVAALALPHGLPRGELHNSHGGAGRRLQGRGDPLRCPA